VSYIQRGRRKEEEEEKDERGSGILGRSHFWSHRIIA
jgi:hypothetical protein